MTDYEGMGVLKGPPALSPLANVVHGAVVLGRIGRWSVADMIDVDTRPAVTKLEQ